jgi:hypothetical protein
LIISYDRTVVKRWPAEFKDRECLGQQESKGASRCKAKLQVKDTSSAASATVNQAGFSAGTRGQVPAPR